jgi:hypothetical protein
MTQFFVGLHQPSDARHFDRCMVSINRLQDRRSDFAVNAWMLDSMNGSNVAGAAVDSLIFPLLAFGLPMLWPIVLGQLVAKIAGGAIWSAVLSACHHSKHASEMVD